jgi:chromosome segregation ATPase
MSEPVSITEELRARIEELTRERDGLKHREDLLKIANEQLLHVNKSVARHGIITESVRRLTDLLSIESTNPTANETTDAAAEAIERLTRERDAANAKHETLSALVDGYRRERDNLRAEITKAQESFDDDGASGWMPGETAIDALIRTRDEARAGVDKLRSQIERLRGVLHIVSLDEYESTTSASEKVHAHARQARIVLNETLADATPSDAAHIASLENLFIKACRRAEKHELASRDAYRRGAEAMREACAEWFKGHDESFELTVDACHEVIADMPIPEGKP